MAVGTYDSHKYNTMGDKEAESKMKDTLRKKAGTEFNMLKMEDNNRKWIERARKEYMGNQYGKGGIPSVAQFLEASGFDPAEFDGKWFDLILWFNRLI